MNRNNNTMPNKAKKILVEVFRVLLGLLFIFSGFVKAVDPLGSAYKFHEYFTAFGMPFMEPLTLPASFILSAFEFSLGVCILLGAYRKATSFSILAFMLVMTPLTLYLAIANPVSDCGCFGDALVISNWETFFKNIFLLAAAIVVYMWSKYITPVLTRKSTWLGVLFSYIFIFGISFYCYLNLPVLDFRPYRTGANIPQLMEIPEGASHDEYKKIYIYEKDGVKKEFTIDNYPANDSLWKFVDAEIKLVRKGYVPPIHDFTITTLDGVDITDVVLTDTSYTFLLISPKLEKANDTNVDKINDIFDYSKIFGYQFYCLTASSSNEITGWIENTGADYPICVTDETTLRTIIRSNPGLLLLKSGTIINKWHHRNIPAGEKLSKPLSESKSEQIPPNRDKQKVIACALWLIIPLSMLYLFDYLIYRRKKQRSA
ncbi:MAG: DoxX family protein [Candidatus Azobacteroides sp.]|nr:DoxX family protein [Candidatus Azobacteroides sp.]